jgi:hypothetical protein
MSGRPDIAFIIPAFNAERTIADTLNSVLAQTSGRWSAVVVDDGSTDKTASIVRSFGDDRIVLIEQSNRGLAGARNAGLVHADAGAVCFLDADDVIDERFVERMLAGLGPADLVACPYRMVGPDLGDLDWTIRPQPQDCDFARLRCVNPLAVGAVVLRRSVLDCLTPSRGPFDESLGVLEDWDLWLRLTVAGARWAMLDGEPLFLYRLRPASLSDDIRRMWTTGTDLIERWPGSDADRADAGSAWSMACLARAMARGDRQLATEIRGRVGPLDAAVLAGMLVHALCREDLVGPSQVCLRRRAWADRLTAVLADDSQRDSIVGALLRRLTPRSDAARSAVDLLGPDDVLVVYGVGRNGRALLDALRDLDPAPPVAWIDDHPDSAVPDCPRLDADQLTDRHLVIVTPDRSSPIVVRLTAMGHTRVVTLDALLEPAHCGSGE